MSIIRLKLVFTIWIISLFFEEGFCSKNFFDFFLIVPFRILTSFLKTGRFMSNCSTCLICSHIVAVSVIMNNLTIFFCVNHHFIGCTCTKFINKPSLSNKLIRSFHFSFSRVKICTRTSVFVNNDYYRILARLLQVHSETD